MTTIDRDGSTLLLRLQDGENRLTGAALDAWEAALEQVEQDGTVGALVTTGEGRFYSNGLDLDGLLSDPDAAGGYLDRVVELLHRLLVLPVATVAAVNGHAFGAGAMLALAHDAAVMREDRGYLCLPEVDLGLPFHPLMSALVVTKLTPSAAQEAMTTGRRYGGTEAVARAVVGTAVPEDRVVETALRLAAERGGKDRGALGAIKADLYAGVAVHRPAGGATAS